MNSASVAMHSLEKAQFFPMTETEAREPSAVERQRHGAESCSERSASGAGCLDLFPLGKSL